MNAAPQFVFGYGSLAVAGEGCHVATLRGYRRTWGVAMDNRIDLPGYKTYRLRADGSRPAIFVAFLDIEPAPDGGITGRCMPVDEQRLRELDERERNYDRVDVSDAIDVPRGRVWTYRGCAAGRARLRHGVRHRCAAVSRDYADDVRAALDEIASPEEAASVESLIGACGLEVLALRRVEIGASAEPSPGA